MLFRQSVIAVFLFAQLSLSWASGMGMGMGMGMTRGMTVDMSIQADVTAHAQHSASHMLASDDATDSTAGQSHDGSDCNTECQVCALVLPSFARVSSFAAPVFEQAPVLQAMPPGAIGHPYRPPSFS